MTTVRATATATMAMVREMATAKGTGTAKATKTGMLAMAAREADRAMVVAMGTAGVRAQVSDGGVAARSRTPAKRPLPTSLPTPCLLRGCTPTSTCETDILRDIARPVRTGTSPNRPAFCSAAPRTTGPHARRQQSYAGSCRAGRRLLPDCGRIAGVRLPLHLLGSSLLLVCGSFVIAPTPIIRHPHSYLQSILGHTSTTGRFFWWLLRFVGPATVTSCPSLVSWRIPGMGWVHPW